MIIEAGFVLLLDFGSFLVYIDSLLKESLVFVADASVHEWIYVKVTQLFVLFLLQVYDELIVKDCRVIVSYDSVQISQVIVTDSILLIKAYGSEVAIFSFRVLSQGTITGSHVTVSLEIATVTDSGLQIIVKTF